MEPCKKKSTLQTTLVRICKSSTQTSCEKLEIARLVLAFSAPLPIHANTHSDLYLSTQQVAHSSQEGTPCPHFTKVFVPLIPIPSWLDICKKNESTTHPCANNTTYVNT